jgi:ferredoxin
MSFKMSDQKNISEENSDHKEILKGPEYKAQVDIDSCKGSGECIAACPEEAIERGPERIPMTCVTDENFEALPGKAVIIEDKCTGCSDYIPVCPNNALTMVSVS